ncbi:MAG: cysteine synthase A [Bacteroidales bacterium]|nr:cysteine synthase A [Bacteroidales bacterium]
MMRSSILKLIGNTPLIELEIHGVNLFLKLESFNPGGSVKDRIALAMIEDAENRGLVNENTVIVEPTSGNTGIGLAMVCAVKGYSLLLTMPESMSLERRKILEMYGAKLFLTPAEKGMKGAIEKAEEIASQLPNVYIPYQFKNNANPQIHYRTTGPEIWEQMQQQIDILVAGVGTGGTITGAGKFLKEKNPNLYIVAVEPADSPVLSGGTPSPHKIQGIGAGFIPEILDTTIYNEIITMGANDAYETAITLAKKGILCGISSGANVHAAIQISKRPEHYGKRIVTFICDTGERYLNNFIEFKKQ